MESLLLHLDEELTNNRRGHSYGTSYDDRGLAYWVQLNSLFCDRLWVPANFLTDSNRIKGVMDVLRLGQADCALTSEFSPFRIFWRHPQRTFVELVDDMVGQHNDVSMRTDGVTTPEWRETAQRLDGSFRLGERVEHAIYDVMLDHDMSVQLMRTEIFNPARNKAKSPALLLRLQECLDLIVERTKGQAIGGYGRNFFYEIFGHSGVSPTKQQVQRREEFGPILKPFLSDHLFQHEFLSGVDYASHTIKAVVTGTALYGEGGEERIDALMPYEYGRTFREGHANDVSSELRADEAYRYTIGGDQLIEMSARQLKSIKDSSEYRAYLSCWRKWRSRGPWSHDDVKTDLEQALDEYLKRISSVLSPVHSRADRLLSVGVTSKYTTAGVSLLVLVASHVAGLSVAVDALSLLGLATPLVGESLLNATTRRTPVQPKVVSMGRVKVRFEKKQTR